jgi:hypothetical protein
MAESDNLPLVEIEIGANAITDACGDSLPLVAVDVLARGISDFWTIPVSKEATKSIIFRCYLTGAQDGLGDTVSSEAMSGTSGTLAHYPVVPGSLNINGYVLWEGLLAPWYAYDDGAGQILGPAGVYLGTINYATGAWNVGLGAFVFGPTFASYQYYDPLVTTLDAALPMSSFQAYLRDGAAGNLTYLSCVIPNSVDYESYISERTNGEIFIQRGYRFLDGTEQMEELLRVDFESLQIQRGANSDSATITGTRLITWGAAKEWTISGLSYYNLQADGKRRIRADLDTFLRVGDVCIYGSGANDYFTVGEIQYIVQALPATMTMEVVEA